MGSIFAGILISNADHIFFTARFGRLLYRKVVPLFLALLLISLFATPPQIPHAHAQPLTGNVCLVDPSTVVASSPCPTSAPTFDGPVGQQIRIGVYVNNSAPMNVLQVTLIANHTFLRPVSVDLTNSVLNVGGQANIAGECLSGVLKVGTVCAPNDSIDTLDLGASTAIGAVTGSPTTGLLFTAVYNITSTTASGGISIGYQSGCSTTSVNSPGNVCLTIAYGSVDAESVLGATFDNSNVGTMPDVVLSSSSSSFGPEFPGTNTATITATAQNTYPSSATDGVTFTTVSSPGLTASVSGSPCLTAGTSCNVMLALVTTGAGTFTVTVFGTYATVDPLGHPDTLVTSITLSVTVFDFSISVNPTSISFSSGSTGTATVKLTSLNGFAGSIALSTGAFLPSGLIVTYAPSSFTLSAGGSQTSTATFHASPASPTTYRGTIRATSGTRTKPSQQLAVSVSPTPDFTINANPLSVPAKVGVSGSSTITITALDSFVSVVALTNKTSSSAFSCSLSPKSITASGNSTLSCIGSAAGFYVANVTGTSGTLAHSALVNFTITVPLPDFALTANPASETVKANAAATSTINVTAAYGFVGTIGLAYSVLPSAGLICSLSNTSIVLNNTHPFGTSSLSCTGSPGGYAVTVTGSNSTNSHSVGFSVTLQDFAIAAAPLSVTVNATVTGSSMINVAPVQGFSDPVSLSLSVLPSSGLTCMLSSPTISGGSGSSTLSCSGKSGSYLVNVTGTSGSLSHSTSVAYTVQDFAVSSSLSSISFGTGSSGSSNITISSLSGFSATVTLSSQASAGLVVSFSSNTVTGGSGTSKMTVSGTVAGSFNVNVTGVSGPLTHTVTVAVTVVPVPDFAVSASPSAVTANVGSSANSTIIVTALNGFTGTITLTNSTSSPMLVCTLSPASISLGASGSSSLSCKGPVGVYTVTVIGSNGTAFHKATVSVKIQDFTISASPASFVIDATSSKNSTITVTGLGGFSGTVYLSISASPGVTAKLSSGSVSGSGVVTLTVSASVAGSYNVNVTGTSGSFQHVSNEILLTIVDFSVTPSPSTIGPIFVGETGNSTITILVQNGFTGTIQLNAVCLVGNNCPLNQTSITNSGAVLLKFKGDNPTDYLVNVTATSGQLSHTVTVTVIVVDFSAIVNPAAVTLSEGSSRSVQLMLTSQNGFTGPVSLNWTGTAESQPSPYPSLTLASGLTLTANGSAGTTVIVTVGNNVLPGFYEDNITAFVGMHEVKASVLIQVPISTFKISGAPPAVTGPSVTSSSLVTITPENGLFGNVNMTVTSPSSSFSCVMSRATVYLPRAGSNTTIVSCTGSPGSYNVTITGIGKTPYLASLTITGHIDFVVADFSIASTPTGILVNTGQQGHAQIKLTWTPSFNGTVSLTTIPPSGLNATFSSSSVSGTGTATLNVASNVGGVYTLVVNATSGSISHSVRLTVTVSPIVGPTTILGLDPTTFYSLVGLAIVAIAGVSIYLYRRGKRTTRTRAKSRR